jgi:diguanylate cyclase (GGDEF)-like protein
VPVTADCPNPPVDTRGEVPHYLISGSAEAILRSFTDALDLVDIGIVLLDPALQTRFINRRLMDMLDVPPDQWVRAPGFRELLNRAEAKGWFAIEPNEASRFLDECEADVRAGSIPPTPVRLKDGRRLLVSCFPCPDGGRILTCADITRELQREVSEALEAGCADMRFQNETLENQAAYLASLAEQADESAQAVEAARRDLEQKMAEQRQLEAELRRLAQFDGLTGVLNRATFLALAQDLLEQGCGLTALMLDVDRFKTNNDRFGHAAGDYALQQLVRVLQAEIRDHDLLGRLGGEEFAVVLAVRSLDEAIAVAERLRTRVAQTPLMFGINRFTMTVSVGVALRQVTDLTIDQVIARADAALYQAKAAGRNRVITAQPAAVA